MKTKHYSLIVMAGLLAGCAPPAPLNTPSGKPEVSIKGKTQAQVVEAVATKCALGGGMVENQTATQVMCARDPGAFMTVMVSGGAGSTLAKTQYTTLAENDGTRLLVTSLWVEGTSGLGGKTRHVMELQGNLAQSYQQQLEGIAASLHGSK